MHKPSKTTADDPDTVPKNIFGEGVHLGGTMFMASEKPPNLKKLFAEIKTIRQLATFQIVLLCENSNFALVIDPFNFLICKTERSPAGDLGRELLISLPFSQDICNVAWILGSHTDDNPETKKPYDKPTHVVMKTSGPRPFHFYQEFRLQKGREFHEAVEEMRMLLRYIPWYFTCHKACYHRLVEKKLSTHPSHSDDTYGERIAVLHEALMEKEE